MNRQVAIQKNPQAHKKYLKEKILQSELLLNEIYFLISLTTLYGVACYPRSNRYCWACIITYPVLCLLLGLLIANVIRAFDPILIHSFLLS